MLFNSTEFIGFFTIVCILYFLSRTSGQQKIILLIASCIFYMFAVPAYLLVILGIILVDYWMGRLMGVSKGKQRKVFLVVSILANIGLLAFFKYFNFAIENMNFVGGMFHIGQFDTLQIILPIGLSFHVFQSLAYVIEVFKRKYKPEKSLSVYALYVLFFPQLVAGPIERPRHLIHQFKIKHEFAYSNVKEGLKFIFWGFFKKVVIADRLAIFVNKFYTNPSGFEGVSAIVVIIFFSFQIYCDFSGYSDIAIGTAKVLGINLINNFNKPYLSASVSEFWRRWHISLSSWFRDYVYIPLGGNRKGDFKRVRNVFITFALTGLWHGANWTFVFWGFLNGIYIALESFLLKKNWALSKWLSIAVTFTLVSFTWVFFRSTSIEQAFYVFGRIPVGLGTFVSHYNDLFYLASKLSLDVGVYDFAFALILIFILIAFEIKSGQLHVVEKINRQTTQVRWAIYYALVISILLFGVFNKTPFIYFRF